MLRRIYSFLLRLHPSGFREEFAGEMLWIFDQARPAGATRLIGDAAASVIRQWCFRSEVDDGGEVGATPDGDRVPLFYSASGDGPRASSVAQGALVALLLMFGLFFLMGRGPMLRNIAIGTRTMRSLLGVKMGSRGGDLKSEVMVKGGRERPTYGLLFEYFRAMPVLYAIDADHDLIISNDEINAAARALRDLDRNRDKQLSPEECGFAIRPGEDPEFVKRVRRWFMRLHPVLAALDTSHDGTLSAVEIATAAAALRTLDWNQDNQLTGEELLPDHIVNAVAVYFSRFDANSDDALSLEEVAGAAAAAQEVVRGADRDQNGQVSESELFNEIRRRAESDGDGGLEQLRTASAPNR